MPPEQIEPVRISIHALREEGDVWVSCTSSFFSSISIHALREEGDSRCLALFHLPAYFYPRPPRGGRPLVLKLRPVVLEISIHALREEGDSSCCARSSRGGRFLSTPSARRATREHQLLGEEPVISIHALREEGDRAGTSLRTSPSDFYPRPPRGGRPLPDGKKVLWDEFLSTPSARRATRTAVGYRLKSIISIHALREEGDAIGVETHRQVTEFLSTPSARRATASVRGFEPSLYNFYPRPPRGGRPAPWNCTTEIA